ncbi:MAG: M48 family metallopeptidase [Deferribacteres bacterium]|nr:M48 family metallopeptidase [Deferribacteres bacterium]
MNGYLTALLAAYFLIIAFGYWLDFLNLSHLKKYGSVIPPEFEGQIDRDLLRRTRDYNIEHTKFDLIASVFNNIVFLIFIFVLLDIYNSWIMSLNLPFILSGLVFFLLLSYADTVISMPFSLYSTFRIENRYGFNTMTFRLWVADTVKSLVISTILMGLLTAVGLFIVLKSPEMWWLWVWCFFLVFGIFIMYIAPYVIEPLFHKFTPIEDEELEGGIRSLMQKAGIKVSRIFRMDASKRTTHTNAYFTGIGRVKRIILYDTLIEKMNRDEILAVLAHEAGHWKKRHLLKHIVVTEAVALIAIYAAYLLLQGDFLTELFSIKESSFFAKVVIVGFIGSIVSFPLTPVFHYFSRRHENEADRFSYELTGNAAGMISALVKLSKDNLSNLHPHPLYALFHYSHPPVLERIRRIREFEKGRL